MKLNIAEVEKVITRPFEQWAGDCHSVSLAIVKSDLIKGPRRVARGACAGVLAQHSWIVVGDDCYDREAQIIDPTLWSYDRSVEGIWYGTILDGKHIPHGMGNIWKCGCPPSAVEPVIELEGLSRAAAAFIEMAGPLDIQGWQVLFSQLPVEGWPAAEIYEAAYKSDELRPLIPIDRLGMVTRINPGGLYLPE